MSLFESGKEYAKFFLLIGVLIAVTGIVLVALRNSQVATSGAAVGIDYTLNATNNFATQLPTIGTILGVALLVVVVFSVIVAAIFKKRNNGGGF